MTKYLIPFVQVHERVQSPAHLPSGLGSLHQGQRHRDQPPLPDPDAVWTGEARPGTHLGAGESDLSRPVDADGVVPGPRNDRSHTGEGSYVLVLN